MDLSAAKEQAAKLVRRLARYKYVLLVIAVGVLLLMWPAQGRGDAAQEQTGEEEEDYSVQALEESLEEILGRIEGAGHVSVMLTVRTGMERVLAQDVEIGQTERSSKTVTVSSGSGKQDVVLLAQRYPVFQGALVVCSGGEDAQVRLEIVQAVSALTGLGTGRIAVCKGN